MTRIDTLYTRPLCTLRGSWLALTALTLLLGCGSHDADIAAPGMDDAPRGSSDSVESASSGPSSDEAALLGVGDSMLSAEGRARAADSATINDISTTNHTSGERIQMRLLTTSEGQLTTLGWHDAELGEDCSFQRDDEGTLRCFPINASEKLFYSNPECSRGFVSDDSVTPGKPGYFFYRKDTACGEGIRAYEIAEESKELPAVYAYNAQRECLPVYPEGHTFRALGAPIDSARFVAAEYGVIESASRVKGYGLIAEDGAVQITAFVDGELNTSCMWAGADVAACLPSGATIDRFADPELSIPLMKDDAAACGAPPTTVGTRYEAASEIARYYRRDGRFEGNTVYGMVPQVLSGPAAIAVQEPYYETTEIPMDRLASGTLHSDVTSRLNPVFWNTEDGSSWFAHWNDLALGSNCTFVADGTGGALCLPDTTGSRVVYGDSACGLPLAEVDANCGGERPQFAIEHPQGVAENAPGNVRRLMTAVPLSAVYESTATGCVMRVARADKHYFGLGEPLPREAFVSAAPAAQPASGGEQPATGVDTTVR
jgi:hypothetical protein